MYARWKWTVRCGLCVVPSILFLSGSLTLYLSPSRYESTAVFEYLGKRPLPEVAALLTSRKVIEQAVSATDLTRRLGVDMETAIDIISKTMEISVEPTTGMIELVVTNTQKEVARDLAAELPESLEHYESTLASRAIDARLKALGTFVREAEDHQESMREILVKTIRANGEPPVNALAGLNVDAARRDWESAQNERLAGEARYKDISFEMENPKKWVAVHSNPRISQTPVGKMPDESLGWVIVQALGAGLACALVIPYFLELAFPRRSRPLPPAKESWADESENLRLDEVSVNG